MKAITLCTVRIPKAKVLHVRDIVQGTRYKIKLYSKYFARWVLAGCLEIVMAHFQYRTSTMVLFICLLNSFSYYKRPQMKKIKMEKKNRKANNKHMFGLECLLFYFFFVENTCSILIMIFLDLEIKRPQKLAIKLTIKLLRDWMEEISIPFSWTYVTRCEKHEYNWIVRKIRRAVGFGRLSSKCQWSSCNIGQVKAWV